MNNDTKIYIKLQFKDVIDKCEDSLKGILSDLHKLYILDVIESSVGAFISRGLLTPQQYLQVTSGNPISLRGRNLFPKSSSKTRPFLFWKCSLALLHFRSRRALITSDSGLDGRTEPTKRFRFQHFCICFVVRCVVVMRQPHRPSHFVAQSAPIVGLGGWGPISFVSPHPTKGVHGALDRVYVLARGAGKNGWLCMECKCVEVNAFVKGKFDVIGMCCCCEIE